MLTLRHRSVCRYSPTFRLAANSDTGNMEDLQDGLDTDGERGVEKDRESADVKVDDKSDVNGEVS